MCCFITESSVEFGHRRGEVLLEDVYDRDVSPSAAGVVVHLGGDPAPDRLGIGAVAAAGAFDAQRLGCQHGDGALHGVLQPRLEQDRALQHDVGRLLRVAPAGEVGHHRRVYQRVERRELLRIAEDPFGQTGAVEPAVAVGFRTETRRDALPQRRVLLHQPLGLGIGVVDRNAALAEKPAYRAFAAADAPRDSHLHHDASG